MTATSTAVESPNSKLSFEFWLSSEGQPRFLVRLGGEVVLGQSNLGIERSDASFEKSLTVCDTTDVSLHRDRYELLVGKRLRHEFEYNQRTWRLSNVDGDRLEIVVRAFNDGVAFRYRFPETSAQLHQVVGEHTAFSFPPSDCWLQPQEAPARTAPAYEANYTNAIASDTASSVAGWTMPALFRTEDAWIVLAEAGVDGQYCGSRLGNQRDGRFPVLLPQPGEGNNVGDVEPRASLPWAMPWRVAIVSTELAVIAESSLITHLNPESRIADTSWIRPGRVAWSWWSDNSSPQQPDKLRRFVDFAAEMGWEHHLIDANWNLVDECKIRELIDYAASKDVGTFLWYNSGGPNNIVAEQPRDRMSDDADRQREFAKVASWGVAGVKVDFFQSDKQDRIQNYRSILRDAADAKLMVNFHGCTAPRGWEREWPNLMTMEAVRGAEQYQAQPGYPAEAPVLHTIFPFTRNLVGSMDYTPVTFSDSKFPHLTTGGFELALAVIVESGLQHFADSPEAYRELPDQALAALAAVPTTWDDTVLLDAYPGLFHAVARRSGADWWIAAINAGGHQRELHLDLSRLDLEVGEQIEILSDGPVPSRDGTAIAADLRRVGADTTLRLPLPPYGGALGRAFRLDG